MPTTTALCHALLKEGKPGITLATIKMVVAVLKCRKVEITETIKYVVRKIKYEWASRLLFLEAENEENEMICGKTCHPANPVAHNSQLITLKRKKYLHP